jgi:hypothetical protein
MAFLLTHRSRCYFHHGIHNWQFQVTSFCAEKLAGEYIQQRLDEMTAPFTSTGCPPLFPVSTCCIQKRHQYMTTTAVILASATFSSTVLPAVPPRLNLSTEPTIRNHNHTREFQTNKTITRIFCFPTCLKFFGTRLWPTSMLALVIDAF